MSGRDIELHPVSDVTDEDKSPTGATAPYDTIKTEAPANHVTGMATGQTAVCMHALFCRLQIQ